MFRKVVGVMDPGLAGEVILPRALASFFPVGRKVARGPFGLLIFFPILIHLRGSLTELSCSAENVRVWRLDPLFKSYIVAIWIKNCIRSLFVLMLQPLALCPGMDGWCDDSWEGMLCMLVSWAVSKTSVFAVHAGFYYPAMYCYNMSHF